MRNPVPTASPRCGRSHRSASIIATALALGTLAGGTYAQAPLDPPRAQAGGQFGFDVAAIPDVNGNGHWDFAVAAPTENHAGRPNGGRIHIFNGRNGGRMRTIIPPMRQMMGSFGWSITGAHDLTGNGRGDLIVGGPWEARVDGTITGRAYLYSAADGRLVRAWSGQSEMSGFGWATAVVPDINGDGVPDIAISAPFQPHPRLGTRIGRVYLFCGRTGGFIRALVSPLAQENGGFGVALAGIEDLNGDGRGEIIVGAPHETGPNQPEGAGRVYIFSGATGRLLRVMGSPNQQDGGRYGFSIGVGDVTGNGRQDIVIGAPGETPPGLPREAGRAYVYDGPNRFGLRHLTSPLPRRMGHFGHAVTVVGDVNADGRNNIVITAPADYPREAPAAAGQAYIFAPTNWRHVRILRSRAPQLNGGFGSAVVALPDIIGNGRAELVVGAHKEDPTGRASHSGRAYLFR